MKAVAPSLTPSEKESRFAEIYKVYGKLIHAYCLRRTDSSQAADAVSETFLVVWRRLDQVPEGEATLPWLYSVAYRVVSHQWRSRARGRRLKARLSGLAEIEAPTPDLVLLRREEDRLVLEAASRLRPIDREILGLTLWEGLSHSQVATALDMDPGAVKQRAYRARRNLASEYLRLTREVQPPAARKEGGEP
jgi:RNA polymerase sigma-70 factor (ECF subfamily)